MAPDRRAAGGWRRAACAGLLAALAGCVAPGSPDADRRAAEPSRPLVLPPANSGEACELRRLASGSQQPPGDRFLIRCGGSDQPSASFARELDPVESLDTVVRTHPFLLAARGEAACGQPQRVGLPQGAALRSAVAVVCRTPPFHAPLILGATIVGRLLVTFATLPQAAPVLEAAVAAMVEEGTVPSSVLAAGTPSLAEVGRRATEAAGGPETLTEVEALRTLLFDAELAAADGDAAGALALRRDLRDRLAGIFGPGASALGPALTEEAALLLRLDRPAEAERRLADAAGPTEQSPLWRDRVRHATVAAQTALALGWPEAVAERLAAADAARDPAVPDDPGHHIAAADVLLAAGQPDAAAERLARARAAAVADRTAALRAPDVAVREAAIAERAGERAAAFERLSEALERRRALYDDDAGVADVLIRLARLDLAEGRGIAARARWRDAVGILLHEASPAAPLPADVTAGFLDGVFAGGGEPDAASLALAFLLLQTPDDPGAGIARSRMLRAVLRADPALANHRLDLAQAERALAELRARRARLRSGKPTPDQSAAADAAVAAARRAVDERAQRFAAAAPATGILAPARRTTPAEAAAVLRPGEVLVVVVPGEVRMTVLALTADGRLTGHRRGPDAATLAARAGPASDDDVLGLAPVVAGATGVILLAPGRAFDRPAQALVPAGPTIATVPSAAALRVTRRPGPSTATGPVAVAAGGPYLGGPGALDGGDCAAPSPPLSLRLPALRGTNALVDVLTAAVGAERRPAVGRGTGAVAEALATGGRAVVLATHLSLPAGGACRGDPGLVVAADAIVPAPELATLRTSSGTVILAAPTAAGAGTGVGIVAEGVMAAGARRVAVVDPALPPATLREAAAFLAGAAARPPASVRVFGAGP